MRVGILTIGNELISGRTQDTNTSHVARELNIQGWQVPILMSVDDDEAAIKTALDHILTQADAVIVTGGLGPTTDDKTTEAIARAYGLKLYRDEAILAKIKAIFDRYGLYWAPNNAKQADFPEGAEPIVNPVGTAWGFSLNVQGKLIAVLPGVPAEMKRMLSQGVLPVLRRTFPEAAQAVATRTLKLSGISEAEVDQRLADADLEGQGVAVGFYPHFPEIRVVLTVRKATDAEAQALLKSAVAQVISRLEHHIFAYDQETLEGTVAALLTERKLTLSIAESCTGGLVTDRLTDISGSSVFLERSAVTYSNLAKTELLGVPEETLREYGAVSEPTARLMAEGVRKLGHTDLGLSTTGVAGPTGGSEQKPVGTVFVALADGRETICRKYLFRWERRRVKVAASQAALTMLKRYLISILE
ncbi:competence/damage-inducible protein cinA [Syntrophus gentianae]|uniref:CinA-like protein n=1 Tax=Syntrophus gentianae TaxID=43775 RepID=A0A1H7UQ37_9BACT|nr:competence/damage-inducible protein A [Syntrophus gentianae]SEL99073.1 competence/damage-inducible protein cinA [Syntrophus gentianae]